MTYKRERANYKTIVLFRIIMIFDLMISTNIVKNPESTPHVTHELEP